MPRLAATFGSRDHRAAFHDRRSPFLSTDLRPIRRFSCGSIFLWINCHASPTQFASGASRSAGTPTNFDNHAFIRPQMDRPFDFCRLAVEIARYQPDATALPFPQPRLAAKVETDQDFGLVKAAREPENVVVRTQWPILAVQQAGLRAPEGNELAVEMQQRTRVAPLSLNGARTVFAERQPGFVGREAAALGIIPTDRRALGIAAVRGIFTCSDPISSPANRNGVPRIVISSIARILD
jgi:hypothetical protein